MNILCFFTGVASSESQSDFVDSLSESLEIGSVEWVSVCPGHCIVYNRATVQVCNTAFSLFRAKFLALASAGLERPFIPSDKSSHTPLLGFDHIHSPEVVMIARFSSNSCFLLGSVPQNKEM